MKKGDNIWKRVDGRFEARYIKARDCDGKIVYGYAYGKTYEEAKEKRDWQLAALRHQTKPKLMNLLILGAGNHGKEVYEIAEGLRVFNKISFLDDYLQGGRIVGRCSDFECYLDEYSLAIPGVGDSNLRKMWISKLTACGFVIPTLIDTTAVISKEAKIGYGTVICARTVINLGSSVGNGCIVSSGAIISKNAHMADWGFINSGEILLENGEIK